MSLSVNRLFDRVKKKEIKAAFTWSFVENMNIEIQKQDKASPLFKRLNDEELPYQAQDGSDDLVGWISLKSYAHFKKFCSIFADFTHVPYNAVVRSCLLQNIVFSLIEMNVVSIRSFTDITIDMINEYMRDDAKLSRNEFDLLFRDNLYGELTLTNIKQLALPTLTLTKEHCAEWHKDPTRHPITKRKLNVTTKNGVFAQLKQLCGSPVPINPSPSKSKTPINLDAQRTKLINTMKRTLAPILHKGDTINARKRFAAIVNNYLGTLEPCIEQYNNKLVLVNKDRIPVVTFDKRIGSDSVYGVAYMNMGMGYAKLLKFSCKLMSSAVRAHKEEIKILQQMSNLVFKESCPNMPITYQSLECTKACTLKDCPNVAKQQYFVVVNELADYDVQTWLKQSHTSAAYQSVVMQMIFAVYAFHNIGYMHNDCHLGNFLVHKITPGGYWRYKVANKNVYVPNEGWQVVLWDPGLASPYDVYNFEDDYLRFINLLIDMQDHSLYQKMKLKSLPNQFVNRSLVPITDVLSSDYTNEEEAINDILDHINDKHAKFPAIVIDKAPPDFLLNVKPYTCVA